MHDTAQVANYAMKTFLICNGSKKKKRFPSDNIHQNLSDSSTAVV